MNSHVLRRPVDVLETIADLSTNEVATPPAFAAEVLNSLPQHVWSNANLKWLDPCVKSGSFLREIAARLMVGLSDQFPNEQKRREHIFKEMLFGLPITELTSLIGRRTLYYSKDASNRSLSVVQFEKAEGNLPFINSQHSFNKSGACTKCRANQREYGLSREGLDNFAYPFIHESEIFGMHFDVIVGNPPYQLGDGSGGKGTSAKPIYQHFVTQAFQMKPRYIAMIIPSRWFTTGKGLDDFRRQMLESKSFTKLVDYPDAKEVFSGPQIKAGVCYFVWDSEYDGPCEIQRSTGGTLGSPVKRHLNAYGDKFVRFNEAAPILEKVLDKETDFLGNHVYSRNPFGLATNMNDSKVDSVRTTLQVHSVNGLIHIDRDKVQKNRELIDKWKTLVPKAGPGNDGYPHKILGEPFVAAPGEVCTESYLVVSAHESEEQAQNQVDYLRTRFARFMIALVKTTQNLTKAGFEFAPNLDWSKKWSDSDLEGHFGLDTDDVDFISTIVKEMY